MITTKEKFGIIFGMILIAMAISIISAETTETISELNDIKLYDCIDLPQTCSNCTYNNITRIYNPDKLIVLNNVEMTKEGVSFYYNFCFNKTGSWIIEGCGDPDSITRCWSYYANVGKKFELVHVLTYLFFLSFCLALTLFSFKLMKNNSIEKDKLTGQQEYELKKRKEFKYYIYLLKQKLWIVGLFGIYLSIFMVMGLLDQLTYNLGLTDLTEILNQVVIVLGWGFIPFVIFWIIYIILFVYKSVEEILKYQYGGFKR